MFLQDMDSHLELQSQHHMQGSMNLLDKELAE